MRMERLIGAMALALVMTWGAAARANDGECSVKDAIKVSGDCQGVNYTGCCNGGGVIWCEEDGTALCQLPCPSDAVCGWLGIWDSPFGPIEVNQYVCGGDGADPSGDNPIDCGYTCTANCSGKTCGTDGCFGDCGACAAGATPECDAATGTCVACAKKCWGRLCGDDGCGGVCGTCPAGDVCIVTDEEDMTSECCSPDCDGKNCGGDGCGGTCGSCAEGTEFCNDTQNCETCTCDGKTCGDDGCGKPCGTCTGGLGCTDGQCVTAPEACVAKDTPGCPGCACEACVCASDALPECCTDAWDGLCAFVCEAYCGGDPCPCIPDCTGKICGDDGCGGTCGACDAEMFCAAQGHECRTCTCEGKECGDDGCGNNCGGCAQGNLCNNGTCVALGCLADPNNGTGCSGCACEACVCDLDDYCCNTEWDSTCAESCVVDCEGNCPCVPNCDESQCGDDGCGGSCGTCGGGWVCDDAGLCCGPKCDGKQCGDNGCGGSCGECGTGTTCEADQCVACTPDCAGKTCGDDGCNGSCGTCGAGTECTEGVCVGANYPDQCKGINTPSGDTCPANLTLEGCCDATGRVVWCDGGKLYCSNCPGATDPEDQTCGWADSEQFTGYDCGQTGEDPSGTNPRTCGFCLPACTGKNCGDDGCGGTCGTCTGGQTCESGVCTGGTADVIEPTDVVDSDVPATDTTVQDNPPPLDPGTDRPSTDNPGTDTTVTDTTLPDAQTDTTGKSSSGGCTAGATAPALPYAMLLIGLAGAFVGRRRRS